MKKYIIPIVLCLALALTVLFALPNQADAATALETGNAILEEALAMEFPTDGSDHPARCPACDKDVTWKALTEKYTSDSEANAHFYLAGDTEYTGEFIKVAEKQGTFCLHTNGHTNTGNRRFINATKNTVVNVMGSGTLKGDPGQYRGTLLANGGGTINIYGTTIESTATATNIYDDSAICAYNMLSTINAWGSNLISGVTPVFATNGTVNLYNCTATGAAAKVSGHQDTESTDAKLNLVNSSVTGVIVNAGSITVSGNTKITGPGLVLPTGATIDVTSLTEGASIAIGSPGAFTVSGMADYAQYFIAANLETEIITSEDGTLFCGNPGAMLIAADGSVAQPEDILSQWATGNYAYIKLYGDETLAMEGQDILIDLNGFDLNVTGTGNIRTFDSANDTFNARACGTITYPDTVTLAEAVAAPNGNRYIIVKESGRATAHRLEIKLTSVSLRTAAAGVYYKAMYNCDSTLAGKVKTYGVIVSVDNMPGANYTDDGTDINMYTVSTATFQSGVTATSGSVFGIMKDARTAQENDTFAKMPIYANAYIDLGNGPIVANIEDPGKIVTDSDFKGTALSLYNVLQKLDELYNDYNTTTRLQLDNFYFQWKDKGMDWSFDNIGKTVGTTDGIDNSDIELKFDEGTTNAECPVCKVNVTWNKLEKKTTEQKLTGHYYLAEDLTYEGSDTAIFYNGTSKTTLCVHLNGHNLTATKTRVVHGSNGRTNIMGNGIVTGYQKSGYYGAAVNINNSVASQSVHLYGGTYRKTANSHVNASSVAVATIGGELNIYPGVTIDNPNGPAIIMKTATNAGATKSKLALFGGTVNGNVLLDGHSATNKFIATTEIANATINGNVEIALNNEVYLSGAPKITSVTMHELFRLTTKSLTEGASIGIANNGVFTMPTENAESYIGYFHGLGAADVITVRDNALHCGPDYTGDLKFAEGTTNAMCPVCAEVVTWTALTVEDSEQKLQGHYYLTENLTYEGEDAAFFYNDKRDTTLCVHLNGHDLTATKTRVVHGSSGRTNIMGSGDVTGYHSHANLGAAVQLNNNVETQSVHLYSGRYQKTSNSHANAAPIAIHVSGGEVNIYEDAIIENAGGLAIVANQPTKTTTKKSRVNVHGGTVNGQIVIQGNDPTKSSAIPTAEFGDCTVNGTVNVALNSDVYLSGAPKIQLLDIAEGELVTLVNLNPGADITVANEGVFTEPNESANDWVKYFHAANQYDLIEVKENALRYKVNYASKLYPDADGKAYCPVCKETVQWTAVSSGESQLVAEAGGHYYLTADILFEKEYDSQNCVSFLHGGTFKNDSACFHLNGYDITATQTHGIYGGYGVLNVMGDGVVAGYSAYSTQNAAAQINCSVSGSALNLYAGTYRKSSNSGADTAVVGIQNVGATLRIYEDVDIASSGKVMYIGTSNYQNANVEIYGATIQGDIEVAAPSEASGDYMAVLTFKDTTVTGTVSLRAGNDLTLNGCSIIGKLAIPAGQLVTFENMQEGSNVAVSADGVFTPYMELADEWLKYITCADAGDWIIVRNKTFYQEVKQEIAAATDADKAALLNTYKDAVVRYGEVHNHSNSGPYRDDGTGKVYNTGADGQKSLEEWIAEMDRLDMDFAFLVDHGQSIHMYEQNFPNWKSDYFIGGTEPAATITDSKAEQKGLHYNMLFSNPADLEAIFFKWEDLFQPVQWTLENFPNANNPYEYGYRIRNANFTTAQFAQLAKDIYAQGGLLVQVHPKYDNYILSDDPLDYYFADYTGLEITTGDGGNMMYKDNNEAYELWVDLLELDKKVFATAGSDQHTLPDYSGLTAIYTVNDHRDDYMTAVHNGNMAPGWIGIRMNVNGTAMGGETSFDGQRLQFSVGEIYNAPALDRMKTPNPYVADHTYRVELYDDGGLLMSSVIDPTLVNYFAVDCDNDAKFYRVVVWDETDNERIGVSNPIWNTAKVGE